MKDNDHERIDQLSVEKRRLLQRLLEEKKKAAETVREAENTEPSAKVLDGERFTIDPHQLPVDANSIPEQVKAETQQFYDTVNGQLNQTDFSVDARFLNYGYAPNDRPQDTTVSLPEHTLNKNAIRLVLELVGALDLTDCAVLDVGCGRGGTLDTLARYYPVGSLTGLDLSFGAIAFCHTNYAHADFYQGDAENLPFASRSFDVVTNVESSHNYPNPWRFYTKVQRILRPGGLFLYTDMLPMTNWERTRTQLQQLGFTCTHDRDITSNVLLSCDQTATLHQLIFPAENDAELMGSFLAVPGSNMYNAMQNGHSSYRILHLRRD